MGTVLGVLKNAWVLSPQISCQARGSASDVTSVYVGKWVYSYVKSFDLSFQIVIILVLSLYVFVLDKVYLPSAQQRLKTGWPYRHAVCWLYAGLNELNTQYIMGTQVVLFFFHHDHLNLPIWSWIYWWFDYSVITSISQYCYDAASLWHMDKYYLMYDANNHFKGWYLSTNSHPTNPFIWPYP